MTDRIGDEPIQPEYIRLMKSIAGVLDEAFNGDKKGKDRKTGFILMVFPFDEVGRCNYVSNANRADVVTMLKEQIARFETEGQA
jgi:hypothetical protein